MKAIIDGKLYDTDTATFIAETTRSELLREVQEWLYRSPNLAILFIARREVPFNAGVNHSIRVVELPEALEWLSDNGIFDQAAYRELGIEIEEA